MLAVKEGVTAGGTMGRDWCDTVPMTVAALSRGPIGRMSGRGGTTRLRIQSCSLPDPLANRTAIARWPRECVDAATALRPFRDLLPDQQRVSGPVYPSTTSAEISSQRGTRGTCVGNGNNLAGRRTSSAR